LYFSSDRKEGFGGFDIYKISVHKNDSLRILGRPINSESDDYALITKDNGKTGYFTSNRNNKQDDIFSFEIEAEFKDCQESFVPKFCYTFIDTESYRNGDHLQYHWDFGDGQISHDKEPYHCYTEVGHKTLVMSIIDTVTEVASMGVGTYELDIYSPLPNYFSQTDFEFANQDKRVEVINYNSGAKLKEGLIWKLDNEYFFYQDYIEIPQNYIGEYQLQAIIGSVDSSSCIQSTLVVNDDSTNVTKLLKIVPGLQPNQVFSSLVVEKIENLIISSGKRPNLSLLFPFGTEQKWKEWVILAQGYMKQNYDIDLATEYSGKGDVILLKLE
jgi:hypothetical protein